MASTSALDLPERLTADLDDPNYRIDYRFSFDVFREADKYSAFIDSIRKTISRRDCPNFGAVKILPKDAKSHFVITLEASAGIVHLLFGVEDIYFKAYRKNEENFWWAFKNFKSRCFRNMEIDESYLTKSGLCEVSGKKRDQVKANRIKLDIAVTTLWNKYLQDTDKVKHSHDLKEIADACLLITQMFAESIRFTAISKFCSKNYENTDPNTNFFTSRLIELENYWGKLGENLPIKNVAHTFKIGTFSATLEHMAACTALIKDVIEEKVEK